MLLPFTAAILFLIGVKSYYFDRLTMVRFKYEFNPGMHDATQL
jgi:hypothetical protein